MHRTQKLKVAALCLWLSAAAAAESPEASQGWPREYTTEEGKLVLYQPQVESWQEYARLRARLALAVAPKGAETPSLGAFEFEADTEADLETRQVRLTNFRIVESSFPSVKPEGVQKIRAFVEELFPEETVVSLDRIVANLERSKAELRPTEVKRVPPKIFISLKPAILVLIDGKPIWSAIEGNDLQFAVNTNWDLFLFSKTSTYYLRNDDAWIKAKNLGGPWSPAGKLPKPFKKLPKKDDNWKEVRASLPGRKIEPQEVPVIYVSEAPAELIAIAGEPGLAIIEGTKLLWVTNTESILLLHAPESRFYYLVAGRWFRAHDLDGAWQFASHDLPEDFAKIPVDHQLASARASVPGTPEAEEAVLQAHIPQKATVERDEVTAEVSYVGDPEFKPIEGTSMYYAVNTQNDVIKVGDLYYLCFQAVWFVSTSPSGPWEMTEKIPDEIYTIPPSSPVHHTTYVHVYDSTPSHVTFGYTSGYGGVYYSYGCMVWGTGWHYDPWYYYGSYYPYPVYYSYPYTYGVGAYYNPYTGTYGRGASVYGPYGGAGRGVAYNPRTGTYARGAAAWGPYNARGWAEAYNPRTGTYAQTRQGANVYSSWGTTAVQRGNDWARTAHYSDSRGTVAGVRTSEGAAAIGVRGDQGSATLGRTAGGDLYAGKDGNVYRRDEGGWQKYDNGNWKSAERSGDRSTLQGQAGERARAAGAGERARTQAGAGTGSKPQIDRGTLDTLNRDYQRRSAGSRRASGYDSWQRSGGARPSRGSYGGRGSFGGRRR